jgi:subtilisin family serine protease
MSEPTNKVVLTVNKGVDIDALIEEVLATGITIFDIYPGSNRNVAFTMTREQMEFWEQDSRVMGCRWGTKAENGIVERTSASINNLSFSRSSGKFTDSSGVYTETNWGLYECSSKNIQTYKWNSIDGIALGGINYILDGSNVDIIIQDSGIEYNHPEFNDASGNTRIKKINWDAGQPITGWNQSSKRVVTYTFSYDTVLPSVGEYVTIIGVLSRIGITPNEYNIDRVIVVAVTNTTITVDYITPRNSNITSIYGAIIAWIQVGEVPTLPNFYTDTNGHGTNVASIAAGKKYGWAKNANIYPFHINLGTDTDGADTTASFVAIRAFHLNKPINPKTGYKNPTIVNMSWTQGVDYYQNSPHVTGGAWRGQRWSSIDGRGVGLIGPRASSMVPQRDSSLDAEIQDCIDVGVIFVGAAGNDGYYIDIDGGSDYNNSVTAYGTQYYYHRGSSPTAASGVICVGAIDYVYQGFEKKNSLTYSSINSTAKMWFSSCGPRIDVWAPGGQILGAWSAAGRTSEYSPTSGPWPYENTTYSKAKESGTSQASPQVTGVLACVLQANPHFNQYDVRRWISENSADDKVANVANSSNNTTAFSITTSYNDPYNLQGSTTKYLYMPYATDNKGNVSGAGSFTGGGVSL